MDAATGRVLYEKDADRQSLIASTTKIMTGLLTAESGRLSETVCIPPEAVGIEGSSLYLKEGERLTVEVNVPVSVAAPVVPGEVTEIPEGEVVIASGPLTSDALAQRLVAHAPLVLQVVMAAAMIWCVMQIKSSDIQPFIYFQF